MFGPAHLQKRVRPGKIEDFAPSLILNFLSKAASRGETSVVPPYVQRFQTVAMFADIAGFTKLSELAAAEGGLGAEKLGSWLNEYFEMLVKIVGAAGGDVFKFAGDAMLIVWPPDLPETIESLVDMSIEVRREISPEQAEREKKALSLTCARAVECAMRIQEELNGVTVDDSVNFQIKLGLGVGTVHVLHTGGIFGRLEFLCTGDALRQAFGAENVCTAGETVVSPEMRSFIDKRFEIVDRPRGNGLVVEVLDGVGRKPLVRTLEHGIADAVSHMLRSYVPAAILPHLNSQSQQWASELRTITVMFVNLGFNMDRLHNVDRRTIKKLQSVLHAVQSTIYQHEGSLNKFLVDDKGSTLLACTGLPPLAHEDDPERAILASLMLVNKLHNLGMQCFVGVTSGIALCGAVGSGNRREYSVLGDVVNTAARLMQQAKEMHMAESTEFTGRILCDKSTKLSAEFNPELLFEELPAVSLKGKAKATAIFQPGKRDTSSGIIPVIWDANEAVQSTGFGGIDIDLIDTVDQMLIEGETPSPVLIGGENGVGKSTLLKHFVKVCVHAFDAVLGTPMLDPDMPDEQLYGIMSQMESIFHDTDDDTAKTPSSIHEWLRRFGAPPDLFERRPSHETAAVADAGGELGAGTGAAGALDDLRRGSAAGSGGTNRRAALDPSAERRTSGDSGIGHGDRRPSADLGDALSGATPSQHRSVSDRTVITGSVSVSQPSVSALSLADKLRTRSGSSVERGSPRTPRRWTRSTNHHKRFGRRQRQRHAFAADKSTRRGSLESAGSVSSAISAMDSPVAAPLSKKSLFLLSRSDPNPKFAEATPQWPPVSASPAMDRASRRAEGPSAVKASPARSPPMRVELLEEEVEPAAPPTRDPEYTVRILYGLGHSFKDSVHAYVWRQLIHQLTSDVMCCYHEDDVLEVASIVSRIVTVGLFGPDAKLDAVRDLERESLCKLVAMHARKTPLVILLDEMQFAGDHDWQLTHQLAEFLDENVETRCFLVCFLRPLHLTRFQPKFRPVANGYYALMGMLSTEYWELQSMDKSQTKRLVKQTLGIKHVSSRLFSLIHNMTSGNPRFVRKFLQACLKVRIIQLSRSTGRRGSRSGADGGPALEATVNLGAADFLPVPYTVQRVIATYVDRLTASQVLVIKLASVLAVGAGQTVTTFDLSLLMGILPADLIMEDSRNRGQATLEVNFRDEVLKEIDVLIQFGLVKVASLVVDGPTRMVAGMGGLHRLMSRDEFGSFVAAEGTESRAFAFVCGLMRDVVYHRMLHEQRKRAHLEAAKCIERFIERAGDHLSAFTFSKRELYKHVFRHLKLGGERARAFEVYDTYIGKTRRHHHHKQRNRAMSHAVPKRKASLMDVFWRRKSSVTSDGVAEDAANASGRRGSMPNFALRTSSVQSIPAATSSPKGSRSLPTSPKDHKKKTRGSWGSLPGDPSDAIPGLVKVESSASLLKETPRGASADAHGGLVTIPDRATPPDGWRSDHGFLVTASGSVMASGSARPPSPGAVGKVPPSTIHARRIDAPGADHEDGSSSGTESTSGVSSSSSTVGGAETESPGTALSGRTPGTAADPGVTSNESGCTAGLCHAISRLFGKNTRVAVEPAVVHSEASKAQRRERLRMDKRGPATNILQTPLVHTGSEYETDVGDSKEGSDGDVGSSKLAPLTESVFDESKKQVDGAATAKPRRSSTFHVAGRRYSTGQAPPAVFQLLAPKQMGSSPSLDIDPSSPAAQQRPHRSKSFLLANTSRPLGSAPATGNQRRRSSVEDQAELLAPGERIAVDLHKSPSAGDLTGSPPVPRRAAGKLDSRTLADATATPSPVRGIRLPADSEGTPSPGVMGKLGTNTSLGGPSGPDYSLSPSTEAVHTATLAANRRKQAIILNKQASLHHIDSKESMSSSRAGSRKTMRGIHGQGSQLRLTVLKVPVPDDVSTGSATSPSGSHPRSPLATDSPSTPTRLSVPRVDGRGRRFSTVSDTGGYAAHFKDGDPDPDDRGSVVSRVSRASLTSGVSPFARQPRTSVSSEEDLHGLNALRRRDSMLRSDRLASILSKVSLWSFDVFTLSHISGDVLAHFTADLESAYDAENSYHNSIKAAECVQAVHVLLTQVEHYVHISEAEALGTILAAACLDVRHPGRDTRFLASINHPIVTNYTDRPLERYHLDEALALLSEDAADGSSRDVLATLRPGVQETVVHVMSELILASSMKDHFEFVTRIAALIDNGGFPDGEDERLALLALVVKVGDIAYNARSFHTAKLWVDRASAEFFDQGDQERELGIKLSNYKDRSAARIAQVQLTISTFFVSPLLELLGEVAPSARDMYQSTFDANLTFWREQDKAIGGTGTVDSLVSMLDDGAGHSGSDADAEPTAQMRTVGDLLASSALETDAAGSKRAIADAQRGATATASLRIKSQAHSAAPAPLQLLPEKLSRSRSVKQALLMQDSPKKLSEMQREQQLQYQRTARPPLSAGASSRSLAADMDGFEADMIAEDRSKLEAFEREIQSKGGANVKLRPIVLPNQGGATPGAISTHTGASTPGALGPADPVLVARLRSRPRANSFRSKGSARSLHSCDSDEKELESLEHDTPKPIIDTRRRGSDGGDSTASNYAGGLRTPQNPLVDRLRGKPRARSVSRVEDTGGTAPPGDDAQMDEAASPTARSGNFRTRLRAYTTDGAPAVASPLRREALTPFEVIAVDAPSDSGARRKHASALRHEIEVAFF